ncbi:hypothetical protein G9A89_010289 [Geosiphon pyriformis]|nr:hypothetical protein G9A89_010289 [Geosiphon pyriformis]
MTDFSLTDGYHVHNDLDQGEVFSLFLWWIFYDLLLYKVRCQESICRYRLNSHFISKNGCAKSWAGHSIFLLLVSFATQHILNIASKFFQINNISINNDKTVVIPINSRVSNLFLSISGLPILVTKKGESHQYLGIFLSTEGFSKPSLVRVHSDVCFFTNLVLKKTVLDKQFLYLVSVVFHPIVSFRTQFSFNALICKGLKLKSGLPLDFPSDTIHHSSFYGLKSFSQCQSEGKVLCWQLVYPLVSSAHFCVNASNNFLTGMVHILFDCKLSLASSLASSFQFHSGVPMLVVLGESLFCKFLSSLQRYGIAFIDQLHDCNGSVFSWRIFKKWKRLDPNGLVPKWFKLSVVFLVALYSSLLVSAGVGPLDICGSNDFIGTNSLFVYMNNLLKNLGTIGYRAGAAAFFEDINLGLGVSIYGLLSFTLMELQAIALVLECMLVACSVYLFSDSQAALDVCKSESNLVCPDFHNWCWVKCQHIRNVICRKNLRVNWHKIKGHSGISENDYADSIADAVSFSGWYLPSHVCKHFLLANGGVVSGNSRHFVHDVFHVVCCAY